MSFDARALPKTLQITQFRTKMEETCELTFEDVKHAATSKSNNGNRCYSNFRKETKSRRKRKDDKCDGIEHLKWR